MSIRDIQLNFYERNEKMLPMAPAIKDDGPDVSSGTFERLPPGLAFFVIEHLRTVYPRAVAIGEMVEKISKEKSLTIDADRLLFWLQQNPRVTSDGSGG